MNAPVAGRWGRSARVRWGAATFAALAVITGCSERPECRKPVQTSYRTIASLTADERAEAVEEYNEALKQAIEREGGGSKPMSPLEVTYDKLAGTAEETRKEGPFGRFVRNANRTIDADNCAKYNAYNARFIDDTLEAVVAGVTAECGSPDSENTLAYVTMYRACASSGAKCKR